MIALLTNTLIREPKTLTISDIKLISKYISSQGIENSLYVVVICCPYYKEEKIKKDASNRLQSSKLFKDIETSAMAFCEISKMRFLSSRIHMTFILERETKKYY